MPKNSPSLKLAPAAAAAHAAAAAAAAARREAGDPDEEMSSAGEDDECAICGNGGKHQPACPEGRLSSATARCPGLPGGSCSTRCSRRLAASPARAAPPRAQSGGLRGCGAAVRPGRRAQQRAQHPASYISPHLPISPYISPGARRAHRVQHPRPAAQPDLVRLLPHRSLLRATGEM